MMPVDVAASKKTASVRDLVLGRKPHGLVNTNKMRRDPAQPP
jgi:hypothetical protein